MTNLSNAKKDWQVVIPALAIKDINTSAIDIDVAG
jgi:hypothetical protein